MGRRSRGRRRAKRVAWVWQGREELRAHLDQAGRLTVVIHDRRRWTGTMKEYAAHWLRTEIAPGSSHEQCYEFLWGD